MVIPSILEDFNLDEDFEGLIGSTLTTSRVVVESYFLDTEIYVGTPGRKDALGNIGFCCSLFRNVARYAWIDSYLSLRVPFWFLSTARYMADSQAHFS